MKTQILKQQQKNIVITGGTSGIGYQMVKILHADNHIIVVGRDLEKLTKLSQQFEGLRIYQADLSNLDDIKAVGTTIAQSYDRIDILINNAAAQYTPHFTDEAFDYNRIASEITLNFTSICSLSFLLLPALLNSPEGIILNINSGLALAPKTSSAIYSSTKAALNSFTQSLRYQLEDSSIQVQQAFLDIVDTPMTNGRGKNKMSSAQAATKILYGMEHNILDHDIGRVFWLKILLRLAPSFAKGMMKKN